MKKVLSHRRFVMLVHVGNGKREIEASNILNGHNVPLFHKVLVLEWMVRPLGHLRVLILDVAE